jgi:hypothetical protein
VLVLHIFVWISRKMEILREHTILWDKIAPSGNFDTRACSSFILSVGGPPISAGKQCIAYLTDHLNEILQGLRKREEFGLKIESFETLSSHEIVGQELGKQDFGGEAPVGQELVGQELVGQELVGQEHVGQELVGQELVGQELVGQELWGQDFREEFVGEAFSEAPPLIDQCEYSLEAEALERLTACVQACFKTDRGIILLENELLLYSDVQESYKDTWFTETCEAWKDRLHSSLGEEFCTALGLWMVSKQTI